jgi:hypothetical protein
MQKFISISSSLTLPKHIKHVIIINQNINKTNMKGVSETLQLSAGDLVERALAMQEIIANRVAIDEVLDPDEAGRDILDEYERQFPGETREGNEKMRYVQFVSALIANISNAQVSVEENNRAILESWAQASGVPRDLCGDVVTELIKRAEEERE